MAEYPDTITVDGVTYPARCTGARMYLNLGPGGKLRRRGPYSFDTVPVDVVEQAYTHVDYGCGIHMYGHVQHAEPGVTPLLSPADNTVSGTGASWEWVQEGWRRQERRRAKQAEESARRAKANARADLERDVVVAARAGDPAAILRAAAALHEGEARGRLMAAAEACDVGGSSRE